MRVRELRALLFDVSDQDAIVLIASRTGEFYPIESVDNAPYGLPEIMLAAGQSDFEYEDRQFEAYLASDEYAEHEKKTRECRIAEARKVLEQYGEA